VIRHDRPARITPSRTVAGAPAERTNRRELPGSRAQRGQRASTWNLRDRSRVFHVESGAFQVGGGPVTTTPDRGDRPERRSP
jgi:hypothetical protein